MNMTNEQIVSLVISIGVPMILCLFMYRGFHDLIKKSSTIKERINGLIMALLSISNFVMLYKILNIIHFF